MKNIFLMYSLFFCFISQVNAQNIGIGTVTPNAAALLHLDVGTSSTKGFLVTGTAVGGTVPDLGQGSRLMFYPGKAAFRAGYVFSTMWDNVNTGYYSVAMGSNTTASGDYSFAMGGSNTYASAPYSVAFGINTIAGGQFAFAQGTSATANGLSSLAHGNNVAASGDYSVAIGHNISTNNKTGSFFLADSDPFNKGVRISGSSDQMAMRFNGGYYFISNNSGADIGVQVLAGSNSWSVASDVRLKENFMLVDEESFLKKIAKLKLTTWNYKTQDPKTFRHYGPMAQDFYKAFGKDDMGTIGCDTLINQQDFLGVNLIAIQALEKRTATLMDENKKLRTENRKQKIETNELKARLDKLEKRLNK